MPADELFDRGLGAIVALREAGALRILPGAPGLIASRIELLEEHPAFSGIVESEQLSTNEIDLVAEEVADALEAVLGDADGDAYALAREREESLPREQSHARYRAVERGFASELDGLRARAWLKQTTKTAVASDVHWDVGVKYGSEAGGPPSPGPVPYAVLQLNARPPTALGVFQEKLMTLTLDREDIDYLLDSLHRLRDAYAAMEEHLGGSAG